MPLIAYKIYFKGALLISIATAFNVYATRDQIFSIKSHLPQLAQGSKVTPKIMCLMNQVKILHAPGAPC